MPSPPVPTRNRLLGSLSPELQKTVLQKAEFVHLDIREKIFEPLKPIDYVDFPEFGVMSVVREMEDGTQIEIAAVGNEGMLGASLLLGVNKIAELAFCQVEGASWRIGREDFENLCSTFDDLRKIVRSYATVYANQISVNLGCIKTHSVHKRCARWLLLTEQRCGSTQFLITQEFLAVMLGVTRTTVSQTASELSDANLISYVRGKMTILDRKGLEDISCACTQSANDFQSLVGCGNEQNEPSPEISETESLKILE